MATRMSLQLPLLFVALLAVGGSGAHAGGGEDEPSLSAEIPPFGRVSIVARMDPDASPPAASLLLEDPAGAAVYRFPPLPGTGEYAYYGISALALEDVDADGHEDVIAIVELVTGIGPEGGEPFRLPGVYLGRDGGFERSTALEMIASSPSVHEGWEDISSLTSILKETAPGR
jgi:hypothetical protein